MPPLTSCSPSGGGGAGQAGLLGQYNVPALPLVSCVTLDKSLSLSAPSFLSLLNSSGNCPCPVGLEVGTGKRINTRNILKTVAHVRPLLQDSQDVSHRRRASHRRRPGNGAPTRSCLDLVLSDQAPYMLSASVIRGVTST